MSRPIILVQPLLAQTAAPKDSPVNKLLADPIGMGLSGVLFFLLIASLVFSKIQISNYDKKLKFEQFKNQEMQKKMKMAIETISKMEKNPDLIHSREFNLDYLRMRMAEENFHFAIVNQIKVKVKDRITIALRPNAENQGKGRQVDEVFDVTYETGEIAKIEKRVLFRIQIKLTKLPTQATSKTISQIIDCLENYLTEKEDHDTWQPTIQGRVAYIHWDQTAKPTPMLVLEQSNEGVNVTFRTTTRRNVAATPDLLDGQTSIPGVTRRSTTGGRSSAGGSKTSGGKRSR
ncbi:hypothetical protein [[Phormidium] sp. ETS-05]|uniref:hypothetical protein n=1 Tax=[Phormidium] sp. ETS-05 TaxID=222819 RepID=UPI0018EEF600|nr:hypothetical protein [[Phormidium] sp. ETS-05]